MLKLVCTLATFVYANTGYFSPVIDWCLVPLFVHTEIVSLFSTWTELQWQFYWIPDFNSQNLDFNLLYWLCTILTQMGQGWIRVITKLPNSEQSYKGKVKTHKYINRQKSVNNRKTVKIVMTLTWYRHFLSDLSIDIHVIPLYV